jgi:hypothetical protein
MFRIFHFPGDDYSEPSVEFEFPPAEEFDRPALIQDFSAKFRDFLVDKATSEEEFLAFRHLQRKCRFLFTSEK